MDQTTIVLLCQKVHLFELHDTWFCLSSTAAHKKNVILCCFTLSLLSVFFLFGFKNIFHSPHCFYCLLTVAWGQIKSTVKKLVFLYCIMYNKINTRFHLIICVCV